MAVDEVLRAVRLEAIGFGCEVGLGKMSKKDLS